MPADTLRRLAITQLGRCSEVPAVARAPKHRAAAETFLALGLSAEAESLLHMAADRPKRGRLTGYRGPVRHCGPAGWTA